MFSLLTLTTNSWAETKDSSKETPKFSTDCSTIKDDEKRLKCYDDLTKDREKLAKHREDFLKTLNSLASFDTSKPKINPKEILEKEEEEKEKERVKQAYMPKVRLYEVNAHYQPKSSYDKTIVPVITFKLQNNGDKTLSKVEVTVYFKDNDENIIFEEVYTPISASSWSSPSKLFKPKYIWQIERGNAYLVSKVPSEWKEGAISSEITDIEFFEETSD